MRRPLIPTLLAISFEASALFLLPDRWHDARHAFVRLLERPFHDYVLVTAALDDPVIARVLIRADDRNVTLITPDTETAGRFALFRHIRVCLLDAAPHYTLLQADRSEFCTAGVALQGEAFSRTRAVVVCGRDRDGGYVARTLLQRCRPYLPHP